MFQSLIGRLKTRSPNAPTDSTNKFQSLIGRLKTMHDRVHVLLLPEFQSLIGRLKTEYRDAARVHAEQVSIPHR